MKGKCGFDTRDEQASFDSNSKTEPNLRRRRLLVWFWRLPVIAALAGGSYAAWRAKRVHFGRVEPNKKPAFKPLKPVHISALEDFTADWSYANFTAGSTPAIAIRLPEPTPASLSVNGAHYAGFSRVCTHQACVVNLNTSPEVVALASNYRPQGPALLCPCHLSVFLPLKSGKAVSGPAVDPLPRLRLTVINNALYANGLETDT